MKSMLCIIGDMLPSRAPQGARGLKFEKVFTERIVYTVAPRKGRVG